MIPPDKRQRYRHHLLDFAGFSLTLAAIPAAVLLGQRLRESQEMAVVVQAPPPMASHSSDRIDALGKMIEKLDQEDAAAEHPGDANRARLAVYSRGRPSAIR